MPKRVRHVVKRIQYPPSCCWRDKCSQPVEGFPKPGCRKKTTPVVKDSAGVGSSRFNKPVPPALRSTEFTEKFGYNCRAVNGCPARDSLSAKFVAFTRLAPKHSRGFIVADHAFGFRIPLDRTSQPNRNVGKMQCRCRPVLRVHIGNRQFARMNTFDEVAHVTAGCLAPIKFGDRVFGKRVIRQSFDGFARQSVSADENAAPFRLRTGRRCECPSLPTASPADHPDTPYRLRIPAECCSRPSSSAVSLARRSTAVQQQFPLGICRVQNS